MNLDQYDTIIDHLVKARKLINDIIVIDAEPVAAVPNFLRDRMRKLIGAQLELTEILLHDYAEMVGMFKVNDTRTPTS